VSATPEQLARIGELLRQLTDAYTGLARGADHLTACDLEPARWFTRNTCVTPDVLRKAPDAEVGRVRRDGKQHLYSKAAVKAYRPDRWKHPRTRLPPA
jgi:hypothetical protein